MRFKKSHSHALEKIYLKSAHKLTCGVDLNPQHANLCCINFTDLLIFPIEFNGKNNICNKTKSISMYSQQNPQVQKKKTK